MKILPGCPASEKHPNVFLRTSIKIDGAATLLGFRRVLDVAEGRSHHPDRSGVEVEVFNAQSEEFTGTHARGVSEMEQNLVLTLGGLDDLLDFFLREPPLLFLRNFRQSEFPVPRAHITPRQN
jgi:hypothetical protein